MKVIKPLFVMLIMHFPLAAQNVMTSSPYSMFGVGEIVTGLYGQNSAMGGVAYGMRQPSLINIENPAGLVGLDSLRLVADISGFVKFESYKSNNNSNDAFTGNVSAFQLGGRIMPRWYAALSLTPYSSVGYYFNSTQEVEGSPGSYITSLFEGSGGLSKLSLSNALLLPWNLSAGANVSYVFGNMKQTETQNTMAVQQKMYAQAVYADFGLQYQRALGKSTLFILGAVYGYRQKLYIDNTRVISTSSSSTQEDVKDADQYLPEFYGAGGSLQHKKWTYALDYSYRKYSSLSSGDTRISFKDTHELRSGISYTPGDSFDRGYWKRVNYKAGFDVSTPYMNINKQSGISWRASLGMDFPLLNGRVSTAVFYDMLKIDNNRLQSKTIGLTVSYSISEKFYKVKL